MADQRGDSYGHLIAALPTDVARGERDRLDCLILGTAIGDKVADFQWAVQELGEGSVDSRLHDAVVAYTQQLAQELGNDVARARHVCGFPDDVNALEAELRRATNEGELTLMRRTLEALSDRLGQIAAGED